MDIAILKNEHGLWCAMRHEITEGDFEPLFEISKETQTLMRSCGFRELQKVDGGFKTVRKEFDGLSPNISVHLRTPAKMDRDPMFQGWPVSFDGIHQAGSVTLFAAVLMDENPMISFAGKTRPKQVLERHMQGLEIKADNGGKGSKDARESLERIKVWSEKVFPEPEVQESEPAPWV